MKNVPLVSVQSSVHTATKEELCVLSENICGSAFCGQLKFKIDVMCVLVCCPFLCKAWVVGAPCRCHGLAFTSQALWVFFRVELYRLLRNWHSSGYPARCLALSVQSWNWLALCQCNVPG